MSTRTKHKSSPESIAWLDEEGRVKPLDPAPYEKSVEPHEKHIQMLRDRYILLALGMKDIRTWLSENESKLNSIMERLNLGNDNESTSNEDNIETI